LFKQFGGGSGGYGGFLSDNADLMNSQGISPADLGSLF
jgi:hypothetical protein